MYSLVVRRGVDMLAFFLSQCFRLGLSYHFLSFCATPGLCFGLDLKTKSGGLMVHHFWFVND
jgi:hypothetical protein